MNRRNILLLSLICLDITTTTAQQINSVRKINRSAVEVIGDGGKNFTLDFYSNSIFRLFEDPNGGILRNPVASPPAQILVDKPKVSVDALNVSERQDVFIVETPSISLTIDKANSTISVSDKRRGKEVLRQTAAAEITPKKYSISFDIHPGEYFYGGGIQNGRFSHRGEQIEIVNTNSWTDGGVCSPAPFYWSTEGYAIMCHTFAPGLYDFGATDKQRVSLTHEADYLDLFVMIDETPVALLNDYYQLTGAPVLLPKFAFYEGHLNAYNRDYWKETSDTLRGVPFEDGKWYQESQKDNGGVRESLNGELDGNYQFSARAVVDRYRDHDLPLGWVLPNDGYGAGYGQTETIDGNIENLRSFGEYAKRQGVEIGLWTQSNLHPVEGVSALLQRDIIKEVRDAGVRVLKTDVAWVGAGYSFGLNGIADVAQTMPFYGNDARPFIITLDGWAGTQRYAGVWTGDQTGGEWEYIRFHIPTYICAGLSGIGNVTSDMDGIFGGRNVPVNVRDYQWKTFTPMQLNMDGWGSNAKYPHALGAKAERINRDYLKLKSMLMPYTYSIAHEMIDGKPMLRAMFLDYPSDYTHGTATRYQFLYGPSFLVAPIYQDTHADSDGNDVRHGIYLPTGTWIDYFTGDRYEGGKILNHFDAPLWKLPLFVKSGAIIPMANASNNPSQIDPKRRIYDCWPDGETSFTEYDDDGTSDQYLEGQSATTQISMSTAKGKAKISIEPTKGTFTGMQRQKRTTILVSATKEPKRVSVRANGKKTDAQWTYGDVDMKATFGYDLKMLKQKKIKIEIGETDITATDIQVEIDGFEFSPTDNSLTRTGTLAQPEAKPAERVEAYALTPAWGAVDNADYYEMEFGGETYSNIRDTRFDIADLKPETEYQFAVRAVNKEGTSEWTRFTGTTCANPLEDAIHGLTAECSAESQAGEGTPRLFDFAPTGNIWHTKYGEKAVPFSLTIDLHAFAQLDKLRYVPRQTGLNGVLTRGHIFTSNDKSQWTAAGEFTWQADNSEKEFKFAEATQARYIRIDVEQAVGDFGSGSEIYVFKQAGSKLMLPGDINIDGKIDENDLTSYTNYTGLRRGDSDFDGYVSKGDVDQNGIIDAYDISVVAVQLDGGVNTQDVKGSLGGDITMKSQTAGNTLTLTISGSNMQEINALSMAIPYKDDELKLTGVEPLAPIAEMKNMTNDRLHSNGEKVLYPTFVNIGNQSAVSGNGELLRLHFQIKKKTKALRLQGVTIVDKLLNVKRQ